MTLVVARCSVPGHIRALAIEKIQDTVNKPKCPTQSPTVLRLAPSVKRPTPPKKSIAPYPTPMLHFHGSVEHIGAVWSIISKRSSKESHSASQVLVPTHLLLLEGSA